MSQPLILTSFDRMRFMVIDDDRTLVELVEAMLLMASVGGVVKTTSCLAAINILAATKTGLPDFWKPVPERTGLPG